jgi:DNA-binding MarR family transcriptional regulator
MRLMGSIVEQYMLLVERISNTTRAHKSFGTDVDIYRSEIHVIQLIGDRKEVFISEIARLIGITKGTVSQIVNRLEAKGLAVKSVDADNNTRQMVQLTAKGMAAYEAHADYHLREHQEMERFLASLSAENREVLGRFLSLAYEMIEDH